MGTLEQKWGPNGDPKTEKGPHGDRVPQMGTHLGAVGEGILFKKIPCTNLARQDVGLGKIAPLNNLSCCFVKTPCTTLWCSGLYFH